MEVLMKTDYSYLLKEYPSTISMDQLYKICHVSKRKAKWLLEHGVIPCKDSGKKTRRFIIKTMDVIKFLEKQEAGKIKNMPPLGTFSSHSSGKKINYIKVNATAFMAFLKNWWLIVPDVLTVKQASVLLGYNKSTVCNWIKKGKLQAVAYKRSHFIPKEWLIMYLSQTVNENRGAKSEKHIGLIKQCKNTEIKSKYNMSIE